MTDPKLDFDEEDGDVVDDEAPKLSNQERLFVDEYLVDLNGTAAAIRAGYAESSAGKRARQILARPHVARAVAAAMQERADRTYITADATLRQLARQMFFDPRRMFDDAGRPLPIPDLPDDLAMAIQSFKYTRDSLDGHVISDTYEVKFCDRNRSAELAMRHLGLFEKDNGQRGGALESLLDMLASRKAGRLQAVDINSTEVPEARKPELQVAQLR
ncbi:MAG: terminase small subunit [Lautropia sp.]